MPKSFFKNIKSRISKQEGTSNEDQTNKAIEQAKNMDEEDIQSHGKYFSIEELWKKIQKFAKKAGSTVIYTVLLLYYTLQKPEIPMNVKATIVGALGYFILPVDLIPDLIPVVGYSDDLAVLTVALFRVALYIDDDVKAKAKNKLSDWFGGDIDTSEVDDKLS